MTIHIAVSADLGRVVRRGIRERVCFAADNWLVGPVANDPQAHIDARCDYWKLRGRERSKFRAALRKVAQTLSSDEPIVVWGSPQWGDRVALWALYAFREALRPGGPPPGLVLMGTPQTEGEAATGGLNPSFSPAEAQDRILSVRSPPGAELARFGRGFRRLCGAAPVLSRSLAQGVEGRELGELGDYQAAFFPSVRDGRLHLSLFDDLVFQCLEAAGQATPVQVFVSRAPAGEPLRRWLTLTGDIFLALRLAQWAEHQNGAALSSEPLDPNNIMKAARYSLTEKGRSLRAMGLPALSDGPPLPVWGATAYSPDAPWAQFGPGAGGMRKLSPS